MKKNELNENGPKERKKGRKRINKKTLVNE